MSRSSSSSDDSSPSTPTHRSLAHETLNFPEMDPSAGLPTRLAAVECEDHPSQSSSSSGVKASPDPVTAAQSHADIQAMLRSLRNGTLHSPTTQQLMESAAQKTRDNSSDSDTEDHLEHTGRLGGANTKRAPLDTTDDASKSASAPITTSSPKKEADTQAQIQLVLDQLNKLTKRASPFPLPKQQELAESMREAAFDQSVRTNVIPADLEMHARTAEQASLVNESSIAHYLTTTPLLYNESSPISMPNANFPLHARANDARTVYEQTIQALYLHAAITDYVRKEKELTDEQAAAIKIKQGERDKRRHSLKDAASSDDDDDEATIPTEFTSLSYEVQASPGATAAASSGKSKVAIYPIDPAMNPELRAMINLVEGAFDMADKVTQKCSAPFRIDMTSTLSLAQSALRLHQSRLDSHPFYSQASFPESYLFNVYYSKENSYLNSKMNDVSEALAFEASHKRKCEIESKKKREAEAKKAPLVRGNTVTPNRGAKKKSGGLFSCCSSAMEEPEANMETRGSAPAAAAAEASVDDSCITRWNTEDSNFHISFERLLLVLTQYEHAEEAEQDRHDEKEKENKAKRVEINFDQLQHPDEIAEKQQVNAANELMRGKNHDSDAVPDGNEEAEERAKSVGIYTTRTWNSRPIRPLSEDCKKILSIFASMWRIGAPYSIGRTLSLYSNNLNFNQPDFYSGIHNQLTMQSLLYKTQVNMSHQRGSKIGGSTGFNPRSSSSSSSSGDSATKVIPFTTKEIADFRQCVRDTWEWLVLSLQRYQNVFAYTHEEKAKDDDPDASPEDHQDGLEEALHLYVKCYELMKELNIPIATQPGTAVSAPATSTKAASSSSASSSSSSSSQTCISVLQSLITASITTQYESALEATAKGESSIFSPQDRESNGKNSPIEDGRIVNPQHLLKLISKITNEIVLDGIRCKIFKDVVKSNNPADVNESKDDSIRDQVELSKLAPTSDAVVHQDGFHLSQVTATLYLTFLYNDTRIYLTTLSQRYTELTKQYEHSSKSRTLRQINEIEQVVESVLQVYAALRDFYAIVARNVILPVAGAKGKGDSILVPASQSWFNPFVTIWLTRIQKEWLSTGSNAPQTNKVATILAHDTFQPKIFGYEYDDQKRYSESLVEIFTSLRVLGRTTLNMPGNQVVIESFAHLISQILTRYIATLYQQLNVVFDREVKKKNLFGVSMTPRGQTMDSTLTYDFFVRINNIYCIHDQLNLLLEELQLKSAWLNLLPGKALIPSPIVVPNGVTTVPATKPADHSPDTQHSADSPVVETLEVPTKKERAASSHELLKQGLPKSPDSGSPQSPNDIPANVLTVLECRATFTEQSRVLDDLLNKLVAGLGVFVESHLHSVIWKTEGEMEEWSGRHTKEEIEPLFTYLVRHFDHIRLFMYDEIFARFMFLLLTDIVLILERELVHPKGKVYKNRLRTEQVHRVIQIHYILLDFFERDYSLPQEYIQRLKQSHLNRLEYIETLLTGGSDSIIEEFDRIDAVEDEKNHDASFTVRETFRLNNVPYMSRRQLAGVVKARSELEGDGSATVLAFIKAHKSGLFSSTYFQ